MPLGGLESGGEEEKQGFLLVPLWLPSRGHSPLIATHDYCVWIYTINIHFICSHIFPFLFIFFVCAFVCFHLESFYSCLKTHF